MDHASTSIASSCSLHERMEGMDAARIVSSDKIVKMQDCCLISSNPYLHLSSAEHVVNSPVCLMICRQALMASYVSNAVSMQCVRLTCIKMVVRPVMSALGASAAEIFDALTRPPAVSRNGCAWLHR